MVTAPVAPTAATDMLPLVGGKEAAGKLWQELEKQAGGRILGHDLILYCRQKAKVWGVADEYISAQGLDDLSCVWACTQGFLQAGESGNIPVLCVFDSEEVGSGSYQGAAADFLQSAVKRICKALQVGGLSPCVAGVADDQVYARVVEVFFYQTERSFGFIERVASAHVSEDVIVKRL